MNNPWMLLVVLATAVLITLLFRGPQQRKTLPAPDDRFGRPPPEPPPVRPANAAEGDMRRHRGYRNPPGSGVGQPAGASSK